MPKLIKDLTNEELDYWAARMQGLETAADCVELHVIYPDETMPRAYSPTTNGGQAMELAKAYNLLVDFRDNRVNYLLKEDWVGANTIEEAIVRACLTAHYGESVPEDVDG